MLLTTSYIYTMEQSLCDRVYSGFRGWVIQKKGEVLGVSDRERTWVSMDKEAVGRYMIINASNYWIVCCYNAPNYWLY